jgi:nitroreductase
VIACYGKKEWLRLMREIEIRRSIRKYKDKAVSDDNIKRLLESARLAPSGSNTQPWRFIVIKSQDMREKISRVCHNQQWMTTAPLFVACVGDMESRIGDGENSNIDETSPEEEVKQIIRDTAIASEHIVLEAQELGLGACWVAWFTQKDIRPVLNVPESKYVVAVLVIGYPDESPEQRPRKKLEDIVHYEKW